MKRYQESNKLIKLWRLRHYVSIPFIFIYSCLTKNVTNKKLLWAILQGEADIKMKHYYTSEEVEEIFKKKL